MPSEKLRKLEVDANAAFEQYREMYFEGGVSSVYLWDLEHGFAGKERRREEEAKELMRLIFTILGAILIKKAGDGSKR